MGNPIQQTKSIAIYRAKKKLKISKLGKSWFNAKFESLLMIIRNPSKRHLREEKRLVKSLTKKEKKSELVIAGFSFKKLTRTLLASAASKTISIVCNRRFQFPCREEGNCQVIYRHVYNKRKLNLFLLLIDVNLQVSVEQHLLCKLLDKRNDCYFSFLIRLKM